jgi:hypothetical protein
VRKRDEKMMNREEDFEGREGRRKGRKEVEGM